MTNPSPATHRRPPVVHAFTDTYTAYNRSQTSNDVHHGDVLLVVEPFDGTITIAVLDRAWPVAITQRHWEFHVLPAEVTLSSVLRHAGNPQSASALLAGIYAAVALARGLEANLADWVDREIPPGTCARCHGEPYGGHEHAPADCPERPDLTGMVQAALAEGWAPSPADRGFVDAWMSGADSYQPDDTTAVYNRTDLRDAVAEILSER